MTVIVLNRGWFMEKNIEGLLLKHEIGHWAGLPARDFHKPKNNKAHCSNLRCLMMPGPGSDPLRWCCNGLLSILFLSPPDFCKNCKAELAQMKALQEAMTGD
ncbi:MAG: hypothetical protein L0Y36_05660 [Planctomycetales bacterium]|nr:hypothetical protein [Planctomycetales bacterium]